MKAIEISEGGTFVIVSDSLSALHASQERNIENCFMKKSYIEL